MCTNLLIFSCSADNTTSFFLFVQLKRLKLRKNNWESETYQFDEILTETASQKRVYEVVAKPVVEVICGTFALNCYFSTFFGIGVYLIQLDIL